MENFDFIVEEGEKAKKQGSYQTAYDKFRDALSELSQFLLKYSINLNSGSTTLVVVIVQHLIKQGVIDPNLLIEELDKAINTIPAGEEHASFASAFYQLAHALDPKKYPKQTSIKYPDWRKMIQNLPPLNE